MAKIEKGTDLMLFVNDGVASSSKVSIAFATNHTLTINAETVEDSHKDIGNVDGIVYSHETVQKITWEISTENLFSLDGEGKNFDDLFAYMAQGKEIDAVFALVNEGSVKHPDVVTGGYTAPTPSADAPTYNGKVVITNLTLNAPNGENATYTATMRGVGKLTKIATAPTPDPNEN